MIAAVPGLNEYSHDDIWKAIGEIRSDASGSGGDSSDLKGPEWEIFTTPNPPQNWPDFMVSRVAAPHEFQSHLDYVVLAERLREVNALVGLAKARATGGGTRRQQSAATRTALERQPRMDTRHRGQR